MLPDFDNSDWIVAVNRVREVLQVFRLRAKPDVECVDEFANLGLEVFTDGPDAGEVIRTDTVGITEFLDGVVTIGHGAL